MASTRVAAIKCENVNINIILEVLAVSGTADVLVTGHGTETATLPLLIVGKEGPSYWEEIG